MDASDLHTKTSKSLMDKIAADPDIINRGMPAVSLNEDTVQAVAPPLAVSTKLPDVTDTTAEPIMMQRDQIHRRVELNLVSPISENQPTKRPKGKVSKVVIIAGIVVVLLGLGGTYWFVSLKIPKRVAKLSATPTATPSPVPTVTPSPTPVPTPTVTPTPPPVSMSVTAPAAAPTASHPQSVTVKTPSGLWLRSSPDSSNKSNIIGWIPNGGEVSVDSVGDFWWHGIYSGKSGYFAVSYTK
jgi:hypothetical protein